MKKIEFYKYQGTGNDFILIDGFNHPDIILSASDIQEMCHRTFGIGADGLMILKPKEGYDFEMDFYNSDGRPGSMCGNGGRCIVAFAHQLNIIDGETKFWAPDGEHTALFESTDKISLKMGNVDDFDEHDLGLFIDTGSPHLIVPKNKHDFNVYEEGKNIRYSEKYKSKGVNVNFVDFSSRPIYLGTYERGVENETYSCGTGTVAAALAANILEQVKPPISLITKGGGLTVQFKTTNHKKFNDIWLTGPAKKVFKGNYIID